jgi:predicted AAA+ superfamily ATPase
MDNISNITSARSITASILNGDTPASNATITSYMKYLCNAYAFYKVRKYDIRGKKYFSSHDKYYLCDHFLDMHSLEEEIWTMVEL